jgi:hypothetical protein
MSCCGNRLNTGMLIKKDSITGALYKTCGHCSNANGSEHVFHRYPTLFGKTPARVTAKNPDGHQSYCNDCRSLPKGESSKAYTHGVLCRSFVAK